MDTTNFTAIASILKPYYTPRPPFPVYVPPNSVDHTAPSPVYCPPSPTYRPPSPVYIPPSSPIYYPSSPALCYPPSPAWVPRKDWQPANPAISEPRWSIPSTPTTEPEPEPGSFDPSAFPLNFPAYRPRFFTSLPDPDPYPDPEPPLRVEDLATPESIPSRKRGRFEEPGDGEVDEVEGYLPDIEEIKTFIMAEERKIKDARGRIKKWRRLITRIAKSSSCRSIDNSIFCC